MSLSQGGRRALLFAGAMGVVAGIIAVRWLELSGYVVLLATLILVAAFVLLLRLATRWHLLRQDSGLTLTQLGRSSAPFFKGLAFVLGSLAWITCIGFGIKYNVFDIASSPIVAAFLVILPFFAFLVIGLILVARSFLSRR